MSTSKRIHDIISPYPMGDVEKYFTYVDSMMDTNSGNNDYRIVSHDSYAISVPIPGGQNTKFRITDSSMDVIDMSQGYINLKCEIELEARFNADLAAQDSSLLATTWWFVGFKSGAHIIDQYNVYSNGRLTECKQTKSKYEQTIVYNCKAKEERHGRPGMYSVHKDVLKMRDCVCGIYVQQPAGLVAATRSQKLATTPFVFDICIQIDDLLPFSGMTYYPRFATKDLELEIQCNLQKNMVWCQVPHEEVIKNRMYVLNQNIYETAATAQKLIFGDVAGNDNKYTAGTYGSQCPILTEKFLSLKDSFLIHQIDHRFHQCGDFAKCLLGRSATAAANDKTGAVYSDSFSGTLVDMTIVPTSLKITEAKSYVFGFNLKPEAKANLMKHFETEGQMRIPAQWIDQTTFPQHSGDYSLKLNTMMNLYECGQIIFTFPNSVNQLTVSRNPMLNAVKCQIGNKVVPDKMMSTCDRAHSEMTLTALGFDSLFSAPPDLIKALSVDKTQTNKNWRSMREDDSGYMFVADLERNGQGQFHDGFSESNCSINFDGTYINEKNNAHYYARDPSISATLADQFALHKVSPHIFAVCDAYWTFGPNGGEFIKDASTVAFIQQAEAKIAQEHAEDIAAIEEATGEPVV